MEAVAFSAEAQIKFLVLETFPCQEIVNGINALIRAAFLQSRPAGTRVMRGIAKCAELQS
ncbi:MAG: hypothetical protein ACYCPP_03335 [Nitrososphaerales archaeon]